VQLFNVPLNPPL